ncbi:histidine triad nucleotide-binding protein [Solemya velesiana gill symbiont]|uniref:Histidine triad nucleotide-binding protein n=1 Tax=Solemya velesiana gill symbiont TaxID=1918948 RepID=A0A1T2KSM8_9GAMM|nr:histidine triad nucleotide-binding protein [Solemya velesiana gill symbiont]OOZ35706.1 histidine triad nucleotide-binding protein [Solemya velesiana gill symbiont]
MEECLFCKMASGEIVPDVVYEDEEVLAFRDINPQAPVHVVIIPKRHIATLNDINRVDAGLIGKLYLAATEVARQEGIAGSGYRTVFNCNRDGGQEVFHLHLHLIGGRPMKWPPG